MIAEQGHLGHPGMCELAKWIKMMATQPQPMAGQKILEQQMIYNSVPVELKIICPWINAPVYCHVAGVFVWAEEHV